MGSTGVIIRETGTITEVRQGIVKLSGLPGCVMGQLIELGPEAQGFIIGFTEAEALALLLGAEASLTVGQRVEVSHQPLRVSVGPALLGRMVSPLGKALDGESDPTAEARQPMFQQAPGVMERAPVERALVTGIRALDAMIPIGRGQRELIIGDRMTGKTALALDAIISQHDQQVVCIYCSIGQSHQKVRHVAQLLREQRALDHTILVAATAAQPASEQFLAPYAACAMGEYFMQQGRDVLVVFDDLSKHAWAYRELSLLLERPPGREAYPGDMFFVHSQLMERAGQFSPQRGGGSMTFLPICDTQQGDVTGYICSNLISMTDGQIYLSSELFYEGMKPAIDMGLSVSRIGNKVQPPLYRWATANLRLEMLQYQELVRLMRFSTTMPEHLVKQQRRGELLRRLITQPASQPMSITDQTWLFYALAAGWLERLTEAGMTLCLLGLSAKMPTLAQEIVREQPAVTPAIQAKLDAALRDVLQPHIQPEEGSSRAVAQTHP